MYLHVHSTPSPPPPPLPQGEILYKPLINSWQNICIHANSLVAISDFLKHTCMFSLADDESWNLVTCFCRRPFAGRPMIECHKCKTWVHLFCAKIKKDQVPDVYICPKCRPPQSKSTTGKQKGVKRSDSNSS